MRRKIQWNCQQFDQLSAKQLYRILQLRSEVFVIEQNCAYQDMDGMDSQACHLSGYEGDELLCYARLFPPGIKYPQASIGRVICSKAVRGKGHGKILMTEAVQTCKTLWPQSDITISAQEPLEKFYHYFGFVGVSQPYMEDGIPHIEMWRKSENADE